MSDQWTDRLSEYIDGELDAREREEIEAHLPVCDECRTVAAQLRDVSDRAAALETVPPAADLWAGIRDRIGGEAHVFPFAHPVTEKRARRFAFSLPQLAAAAAVVAFLSGGTVWLALATAAPQEPAFAVAPVGDATGPETAAAVRFAGSEYELAIDQLEHELVVARVRLDPATVAVVEHNLEVIDAAIAEARQALAGDPASPYLNRHLDNTLMKKIEVLRRVTTIGRGTT